VVFSSAKVLLDQRRRRLELVAVVETVEQRALDALAGGAGELGDQALARGFLQLVERFEAKRLGELVVDLSLAGRFDCGRGGLELGRLACELLAGVVLRE
jgi:hypothetical protein